MLLGRIHSIESMGLVDGPGIRTVVFLQGCRLRCRYCHNPDTWALSGEKEQLLAPAELVKKLIRFKPYYGKQGGVTFSGGEPLLQKEFLLETLKLCREAGIHTCLDTAGCGEGGYEEILNYTDLVLFDVKHYTREGYRAVTGQDPDEALKFFATLEESGTPYWVRHVVVPHLTDGKEHLEGLEKYLSGRAQLQKVELLPYHVLGKSKYHSLGIPCPLERTEAMDPEVTAEWQERINRNLNLK